MLVLYIVGSLLLLAVDQLSKLLVCEFLQPIFSVPLWKNVFHLTYVENRGAAFGILQNKFIFFYIVTVLVILGVTIFLIIKRPKSPCLNVALTLLAGGALGNFVDRLFRGFVVDFLDFRLIHFPVFNLADCFVVCGAFLLAGYIIFLEGKENRKNGMSEK